MAAAKSNFLDRVLGRIGRLDKQGLQTIIERLARERTFLERLFNTIEDGVLVIDESGRILYFNEAVTGLIGLQTDEAEGRSISRYLPDLDWKKLLREGVGNPGRVTRREMEVFYPRQRFIRLYASSLDSESGGNSGLALILHDATEARQQTFEAIESERIQALTLLAASVAHEIGNPLNALHIHLQLMERECRKLRLAATGRSAGAEDRHDWFDISERLEKYLEVCKGEIGRLDYIVTQFLQAIRPTQPKLEPDSLNRVVTEVAELLAPELENRSLAVKLRLGQRLPKAPIDAAQMKQALVNLVKNAMQAMTKGGVLTLRTGAGNEGVWMSVEDTGGGIPQEQINRIFQPFFTTKKKGSGLGLMIVQRIVREHGGRIELESRVGEGTTFRIWLPLHERQPRMIGEASEPN